MTIDPVKRIQIVDWGEYNKKKLANILEVPYTKEEITKAIGVAKPWADLITDDRHRLLGKLKPGLFDKLIDAIKNIDSPDKKAVKNSQG